MKVRDEEFTCPVCKAKAEGIIIRDYSNRHNKETMVECMKCDSVYIIHYKFDRVEILSRRKRMRNDQKRDEGEGFEETRAKS